MNCDRCHCPIDPDRAEFLRETGRALVCMSCTGERPKLVLMEYGHKTAGYAVAVPQNRECERRALRSFRRAR
jgi:hypothetical protein